MLTSINQYSAPADSEQDLWEYETQIGRENFLIASDAFTLVMGRSVRDNVDLCSQLAIEIARTGRTALLLNTFATRDRLVMSLESARGEDLPLLIDDVAIGDWDSRAVEELVKAGGVQALFINSFEFAALSQWQKGQMANALLKMQRRTGLAIVLFTHRIEHTMAAGDVARGPLGIMTPFAIQVVHLGSLRSSSNTVAPRHAAQEATQEAPLHEKAIEVRESESDRQPTPKSINDTSFVLTKPNAARRNAATAMVGT